MPGRSAVVDPGEVGRGERKNGVRRAGHASAHEGRLLAGPVLADRDRGRGRAHRPAIAASASSASAGTFSNSVVIGGGLPQREWPAHRGRGSRLCTWRCAMQAGRAGRIRIEHRDRIAGALRSVGEHAAQLAAAEHAERGARGDEGSRTRIAAAGAPIGAAGAAWSSATASSLQLGAHRPRRVASGAGGRRRASHAARHRRWPAWRRRTAPRWRHRPCTDGEGGHRNAARHLDDGMQRIDALQVPARHRHAEHRHRRLRGQHAGQVRGRRRLRR